MLSGASYCPTLHPPWDGLESYLVCLIAPHCILLRMISNVIWCILLPHTASSLKWSRMLSGASYCPTLHPPWDGLECYLVCLIAPHCILLRMISNVIWCILLPHTASSLKWSRMLSGASCCFTLHPPWNGLLIEKVFNFVTKFVCSFGCTYIKTASSTDLAYYESGLFMSKYVVCE